MKIPKAMKTIQIEITNACFNNCSNCTRFCGWHKKPFFMDFETFKKAVDSLEGYEGMIGIMGGEPTLHPEFQKFIDYYAQKTQEDKQIYNFVIPENDMSYYRDVYLGDIFSKRGLWSSLGNKYYKNFEKIQKTFRYQCINDHTNSGEHQALLVARKDLGISDEQFYELRDKCWIQNMWSASITPKGCFFCEVAAALDMLFDGPGGLPIEKGWWLRRPQDFGEQLNWCEYCSACLKVPSKQGNCGVDIISPTLYQKLKNRDVYKAKNKCYQLFTKEDYQKYNGTINQIKADPYMKLGEDRVSKTNLSIKPNKINICYLNDVTNKFEMFEEISKEKLENKQFEDWCLIIKNDCEIDINMLTQRIYNPGVLYINQDYYFVNSKALSLRNYNIDNYLEKRFDDNSKCFIGKFHVENEDIKYSFLMPTYNSEKTIETAIESIVNQDYQNWNIYFVDDGSTDNTIEIISKYMEKDKRFQCICKNEKNSSAVISRNKLIDLADGDYSIWCDSDDEMNLNMCSFATWLLHQEKFEIIDFPFEVVQCSEQHNFGFRYEGHHKLYGKACYDYFALKKKNPFNLWSKVIKTSLLKKMKIENTRIDLVDDMAFAFPLYYNCQSYYSVNSEKMYFYKWGNGFWGQNIIDFQRFKKNCDGIKKAYDINYKFMLKYSPQLKYFERYKKTSCINVPYHLINKVKPEQRFEAIKYYRDNFKEDDF